MAIDIHRSTVDSICLVFVKEDVVSIETLSAKQALLPLVLQFMVIVNVLLGKLFGVHSRLAPSQRHGVCNRLNVMLTHVFAFYSLNVVTDLLIRVLAEVEVAACK